jgi:hypothetical protein
MRARYYKTDLPLVEPFLLSTVHQAAAFRLLDPMRNVMRDRDQLFS